MITGKDDIELVKAIEVTYIDQRQVTTLGTLGSTGTSKGETRREISVGFWQGKTGQNCEKTKSTDAYNASQVMSSSNIGCEF